MVSSSKNRTKIAEVSALILAGGRSRRMGRDKALIELGGMTLLERTARQAAGVFEQVWISGTADLARLGFPVIPDREPGLGPIGGIITGLESIETPWLFALPCDSPFLSGAFLRGLAALTADCEVVIPRRNQFYEPLHALYARACLPALRELVAQGERQIIKLYPMVRVKEVGEDLLNQWDPEGLAFFNVNTPEDLKQAEEIMQRQEEKVKSKKAKI